MIETIKCPFCEFDLSKSEYNHLNKRYECINENCIIVKTPSEFTIEIEDAAMLTWSFCYDDLIIRNSTIENYCFCSKCIVNPNNTLHYTTIFECEAWKENPFNKTELLNKLKFCLTFL